MVKPSGICSENEDMGHFFPYPQNRTKMESRLCSLVLQDSPVVTETHMLTRSEIVPKVCITTRNTYLGNKFASC